MINFDLPWILILIPLPIGLYYLLPPIKIQRNGAIRVPFYDRMQTCKSAQRSIKRSRFPMLPWIMWVFLIIALAGPQWLGKPIPITRQARNIFLAIDVSGSMQTKDMKVGGRDYDRLSLVKGVARRFIQRRRGDRIGLILFGSRAYLQTPLTHDLTTVTNQLNDATIGLAGQRTAMGDAIGLAIKRFEKTPEKSRVLVLLTDGVTNAGVDPIKAAELAKRYHIRIYTIGLGADDQMINTPFGTQFLKKATDLDPKTLKRIADLTGGVFFRALDARSLVQAYQALDQLEPVKTDSAVYQPIKLLYAWPLSIALLLGFWLFTTSLRSFWYRWRTRYQGEQYNVS